MRAAVEEFRRGTVCKCHAARAACAGCDCQAGRIVVRIASSSQARGVPVICCVVMRVCCMYSQCAPPRVMFLFCPACRMAFVGLSAGGTGEKEIDKRDGGGGGSQLALREGGEGRVRYRKPNGLSGRYGWALFYRAGGRRCRCVWWHSWVTRVF